MEGRQDKFDIVKILKYILKRAWVVVLCAELGFGTLYIYTTRFVPETFTSSGRMYVNNGNPNLTEYQYTNTGDLNSAVQLINTYLVVVRSDKVMNAVVEKLSDNYPDITANTISPTLSMASVSETGVVAVSSKTRDAQMSTDIVNAVMEYAPDEIIRVVNAGSIEIIDYAKVPVLPDNRREIPQGLLGAIAGAIVGILLLILIYMLNQRVTDADDLTSNYTPPVLASLQRMNVNNAEPNSFLLTNQSPMEVMESYSKLRMNLLYTLVGKNSHSVVISSSISGEGKTTIAANLAVSCAMGGKRVLLVDGDLRRACQRDIFKIDNRAKGLSDILIGSYKWQDTIIKDVSETLDLLPAGHFPPNPAELLGSNEMTSLLKELENEYDLVLLDMPPINIVSDPLVLSTNVAGCLFVVRQNFSDHRDIRKSLIAAEMTGMNILGFVFYGESINQGGYYNRRYYKSYYNKYDYRKRPEEAQAQAIASEAMKNTTNAEASVTEKTSEAVPRVSTENVGASQSDDEIVKNTYLK